MITVILFGLVATAAAGPQFRHYGSHNSHFINDPIAEDIFDTRQFLAKLIDEMRQIDDMLASYNKRVLSQPGDSRVVGNEYIITIRLIGFEQNDIAVTAQDGFLNVQVVHKMTAGGEITYKATMTLPSNVVGTGSWTFKDGILKIVFPLRTGAVITTEATKVDVTEMPVYKDKEEMDNKSKESDTDVDVGLKGDLDKTELETNEIPRNKVEVTTSAVDLKDDVKVVPVQDSYHFEIIQ